MRLAKNGYCLTHDIDSDLLHHLHGLGGVGAGARFGQAGHQRRKSAKAGHRALALTPFLRHLGVGLPVSKLKP